MARPVIQGLDYFPIDSNLYHDRKFRKPKMEHGYLVYDVYLILLGMIYSDKGYYLDYSQQVREDVCFEIYTILTGKYQPDLQKIQDVIDSLISAELFNRDLFLKQSVLTSRRVQRTFYSATVKRRSININPALWLLSIEEMKELSEKHVILSQIVIDGKTGVIDGKTGVIDDKNTTKEKEIEREIEIERESENSGKAAAPDTSSDNFYVFGAVRMTNYRYAELLYRFGTDVTDAYIAKLDYQITEKGKTYSNHAKVVKMWMLEDGVAVKASDEDYKEVARHTPFKKLVQQLKYGDDVMLQGANDVPTFNR